MRSEMTRPRRLWVAYTLWTVVTIAVMLFVWHKGAHAQERPVTTQPLQANSLNSSTTITATNVYQTVFVASTNQRGRAGCTIINYGANTMWVYEDATIVGLTAINAAVATYKARSVQLSTGQAYYCSRSGVTIRSAIVITGTSGDAFFAAAQ